MVALFFLLSILDVVGIGLIAPYMMMIVNPDSFMQSDTGLYLHSILNLEVADILIVSGIFLVLVFLVKTIVGIFVNYIILRFCYGQGYKVRSLLMKNYQDMEYVKYTKRNSSEYIHHIQVAADKFSIGVLQAMFRVASETLVIVVILLFLAWHSIEMVVLLFTLMGIVVLFYDLYFGNKVKAYGKLSNKHSTAMVKGVHEGIDGFKEIRVLGKESYFYNIVKKGAKGYSENNLKTSHITLVPRYLLELILVLFIVLVVNIFSLLDRDASELLPTLGMFGVAAIRLAPSVNRVISSVTMIRFGVNFIDLIYRDLVGKNPEVDSRISSHQKSKHSIFCLLQVDGVTFSYSGRDSHVLKNTSFEVKAGELVGIIGASGSGKSTLIDLIIGLIVPDSGKILVNGKPVNENISEWMSYIAYIPQQIFLIDDTLEKNIALGEVGMIDKVKMDLAIRQSRLEGVVDGLKYGIKTNIGEKGVQLSGGQRQRVALARAFYYGRDVLIMDEATSALDGETESEIVDEIKRLKGVKTTIVIAHRLTTLQHCDRIYRLEDGNISECHDYKAIVDGDLE